MFLFNKYIGYFILLITIVSCTADLDILYPESETKPVISTKKSEVLLFTKTRGFKRASIANGIQVITALGEEQNFIVSNSDDSSWFTEQNISRFKLVIFMNTTGDILSDGEQRVFENYINGGGNFMGIHSAVETENDWPWYGQMLGAKVKSYVAVQEATLHVLDKSHLSTQHLNDNWVRTDEWYEFKELNSDINVILDLGNTADTDSPIAWFYENNGSRFFYTGGGHTEESYTEPDFVEHLLGGILYCLNQEKIESTGE